MDQKKPPRLQLSPWPYPPATFHARRSVEGADKTKPPGQKSKVSSVCIYKAPPKLTFTD